jgi:hypothetical protein
MQLAELLLEVDLCGHFQANAETGCAVSQKGSGLT